MMLSMTFHTCARLASIPILTFALALPARAVSLLGNADIEYALAQVAVAYAKGTNRGIVSLVTAERYALRGSLENWKTPEFTQKRATGLLPKGSGPWQRAHDVFLASERAAKRKR